LLANVANALAATLRRVKIAIDREMRYGIESEDMVDSLVQLRRKNEAAALG
jgi:hypothetical protein